MSLSLNTRDIMRADHSGVLLIQLFEDALKELDRACGKFPMFPDRLTEFDLETTGQMLNVVRQKNDRAGGSDATADSVIREEMLEAYEAALAGNHAEARKEYVQVMAMVMRSYLHLGQYVAAAEREGRQ